MESPLHSATPINSRKRPRENETEGQRLKREKAAERQRRKRERDRNINAGISVISQFPPQVDHHHLQQQQQQQQHQQHQLHHPPQPQPIPIPQPTTPVYSNQDLSPEERARRDRVRAAARERQRKHRLLVKQRKMRELGLDMGNEIPGMEDPQYRVNADGQYQQVMQQQPQPPPQAGDIPFPPQGQLGGQTFASTLLLSFSCAPLLKAHLMRTLHMNNDELASLEPVLAEAWERWDHAVCSHFLSLILIFNPFSSDVPTMLRQSKQVYQSLPPEQVHMPSKFHKIPRPAHTEFHQAPQMALIPWMHQATSSALAFTDHLLPLLPSVLSLLLLRLQRKHSSSNNSSKQRQHPRASRQIRLIRI